MGKFLTTEEWIQKAIKVHGDMYDYSKVEYKNSKEKVIIGCKKCVKDFKQSIEHHLSGKGCPYCRNSKGETEVDITLQEATGLLANIKKSAFQTQMNFTIPVH